MDEGYTVNAVISINESGRPILDSGETYSCPTYCYPTAFIVDWLGDQNASYRLLAAVAGTIFIAVIFFITHQLLTTHIALLTTLFLTFSYWHIAWSRQARWYTLFVLFFWLALYFFYRYRQSKKTKTFILAALFSVLAVLTHGLGYLLPVIFIIWTLIDKFFFKKELLNLKGLSVISIAALVFLAVAEYSAGLVSNASIHYQLPYYISFYLRTYWLFIALGILGFFASFETYKKTYLFLFTVLLTYLIPLSFLTDIVHYRYLFHITPIFFIFGAIGVVALSNEIKPLWGKVVLYITVLITFFTIGGGVLTPQSNYYLESDSPISLGERPHYAYTPQPNWQMAYSYIRENRSADDLIISSHPHFNKIYLHEPGYWIKFNYLGFDDRNEYTKDDKEFYVGAKIIDDLAELKEITANASGFIVFDFMAADGRISEDVLNYVDSTFTLVFHEQTNPWSEIWVYKF